jgi:hypothetical protein
MLSTTRILSAGHSPKAVGVVWNMYWTWRLVPAGSVMFDQAELSSMATQISIDFQDSIYV